MKNDAFLWYNVGDWSTYGLAVPNYGDDLNSQNSTIRDFTNTIGRNLQRMMWDVDARMRTPPSINTIRRIHKLCVRARSLFASRAIPPGQNNMESAHALPAPEEFCVYPTPYFNVRNSWMKDYCGLALLALTEAIQHTENARPMEISTDFGGLIGQYFNRIYQRIAVELLQVPIADVQAPGFTITEEQMIAYNPAQWFTSTEMTDTVPPLGDWPTEDDLKLISDGIPVSRLPLLGRYPSAAGNGTAVNNGGGTAATASANPSGASFLPAPGV